MDFEVVILGSDINAYYMARNFHEAYNRKCYMIGKTKMNFTDYSNIINIKYVDNLWNKDIFLNALDNFSKRHSDKKLVLIASNDTYVRLIVENAKSLNKNYVYNYPSLDIINNLLIKENFYTKYQDILDIPKTIIYHCFKDKLTKKDLKDFQYPIILKPSDGVLYYDHKFENQAKVYKITSYENLIDVIKAIEHSGYDGSLIIQEFIPGDDSTLFDSILYVDKKHNVLLQSFAQIGLQEHSHTGVGNCTLLINGYNEYHNTHIIIDKLRQFLKDIKYNGIAEFDLKYDIRDKKFKVLEINPRQARSSYYLTALGYNLTEYLIDELIYQKKKEFHFIDEEMCLTFVPKSVIKNYVVNDKYKKEIKKLYKEKKVVNPLKYSKDNHFKRKLWLFVRDLNYNKKYKRNKW